MVVITHPLCGLSTTYVLPIFNILPTKVMITHDTVDIYLLLEKWSPQTHLGESRQTLDSPLLSHLHLFPPGASPISHRVNHEPNHHTPVTSGNPPPRRVCTCWIRATTSVSLGLVFQAEAWLRFAVSLLFVGVEVILMMSSRLKEFKEPKITG